MNNAARLVEKVYLSPFFFTASVLPFANDILKYLVKTTTSSEHEKKATSMNKQKICDR